MSKLGAYGQANKPVAGISAGDIAIWNAGVDGTDYAPLRSPMAHLDKIAFHSDFDYLWVGPSPRKSTDPGMSPVTAPAVGINSVQSIEVALFNHGLGFVPFLSGDIIVDGYRQPCAGSMIPVPGGNAANAGWRFCTFTADATSVYLHVFGLISNAMTLHWEVRVYEEEFGVVTPPAVNFRFEAGAAALKSLGKIDSDHRYVRAAAGAGDFRVLGKQTIDLRQRSGVFGPDFHWSDGQVSGAKPTFIAGPSAPAAPAPAFSVTGQAAEL
ncbi:MAG: hypothetical protein P1U84_12225 [Parvibaculaceae bacterium]|nr:hypothetical protein [Parvibaculaceae bacterium]